MPLLQSFYQVIVLTAFVQMSLRANVTQQMAMNDIFNKTFYRSAAANGSRIRTHSPDIVQSLSALYSCINHFSDFV
jgi:hypothetical protein